MLQKISGKTNAVNWFEIPVSDIDRAKKFYETVLDIQMTLAEPREGEAMVFFPRLPDTVMGLSGILSGALIKNDRVKPSASGVLIYLNASPALQPAIDKVVVAGGKIIVPKAQTPAGFIVVITDSEGNTIGLHAEA